MVIIFYICIIVEHSRDVMGLDSVPVQTNLELWNE